VKWAVLASHWAQPCPIAAYPVAGLATRLDMFVGNQIADNHLICWFTPASCTPSHLVGCCKAFAPPVKYARPRILFAHSPWYSPARDAP
jgi:hypothetical protein